MISFVINEVPLEDLHRGSAAVQRCWGIQGKEKHSFYSLSFLVSLFVVCSLSM